MKVEKVQIRNFRSVFSCELGSCGGFNVLIGKNNSGKSNVLSAINAFFSAVKDGDIVSLDPFVNKQLDFYNKNAESPSEVTLTFLLEKEERAELKAGIFEDFPQMSNAVDNLDPSLRLKVRIGFELHPYNYACVNRISLATPIDSDEPDPNSERIILDVNSEAALRLHETYRQHRNDEERISALRDLAHTSREDWSVLRRQHDEQVPGIRRYTGLSRRVILDGPTQQLAESAMRDSATVEEYRNALEAEINTLIHYAANSDKNELDQQLVQTFAGRESAIPRHVLKLLHTLSQVKVLNVTEDRRPIGREEAQRLLNLKTQRGGQEPLRRIQEVVSTLLGVEIDAFTGAPILPTREPSAELDVDDFIVQVNGSGIREALRLLLDIEFEKPNLLLVEEPEIHLHPALETSLMRHLQGVSQDCQVFITTHSTNFLDTAEMKNIYLVSKPDSTSVQLLDRGEVEEQVPTALGIRLSSLFIYDRLVFVESQTDEDIIREWASTLGINLTQANVGFVHMGGARNLSYFAASSTLALMAKRQIKMWFMIDRDERDEKEIRAIQERLGDNAAASVLNKREIENYLVHPRILTDQMNLKLQANGTQNGSTPDIEAVREAIGEEAENLKSITIFKRVAKIICRPLYPNRGRLFEDIGQMTVQEKASAEIGVLETKLTDLKTSIADVTEKESEEVQSRWKEHRLDMVPGDLLIDGVYRRYGVRFHKERGDGVQIAGLMTREEIGAELAGLIESIVT